MASTSSVAKRKIRRAIGKVVGGEYVPWLVRAFFTKLPKADLVFASFGPPESAILGRIFARRLNVPLVIELRDMWAGADAFGYGSSLHRFFEKSVCSSASELVVTTGALSSVYRERYPATPVTTVWNGIDNIYPYLRVAPIKEAPLHLVYAGSIYGSRNFDCLIRALRALEQHVHFEVFGNISASQQAELLSAVDGTNVTVRFPGILERDKLAKALSIAHVLVLVTHQDAASAKLVPAKLFEYLGIQRPILAITEDDIIKKILTDVQAPAAVVPFDENAIASALLSYNDWAFKPARGLERLSRREQIRLLADVLNRVHRDAKR